jgi:hypothetical protein
MDKKEFRDLAKRSEELENFFSNVTRIFDRHLDRESQGSINSASNTFEELKILLRKKAEEGESLENSSEATFGDIVATGEKATEITEEVIEQEIKAIRSELEDLEEDGIWDNPYE